jgi:hypothetical protein
MKEMPVCQFCNKDMSTLSSLNHHQKRTKKCLIIQGIVPKGEFKCHTCISTFLTKVSLSKHIISCNNKHLAETNANILIQNKIKELEDIENIKKNYLLLQEQQRITETKYTTLQDNHNNLLDNYNKLLEEKKTTEAKYENIIERITKEALSHNFEDETIIEIDDTLSESQFTVDESESETDDVDNYKLTPLEVGQGYTIEHREEDGYINVTNLCKAGGKQFKHWNRLDKTKAFLQVLSSAVHIRTAELIKLGKGLKNIKDSTQGTWVHPQIAINIAQWISPQFDVKVSGWVYEIMMTGKVDITNTKTYKELQKENKNKELKIQYITKKYVKSQPRVQYEEKNVVYILTTKLMKKDRRYILGKATNLTSRLSTYNKSDEHEVVYYASCEDEETMSCVETMVFQYLNEYREQANRERFILPEKKEISFFSDVIKKSVEFFKK